MSIKMALRCISFALLLVLAIAGAPLVLPASALADSGQATVKDGGAAIQFPNTITFKANVTAPDPVERVVLEYGVNELTCGTVVAKGYPQFKPANSVDVSWTWDMRKSGSAPPGARIWYQWRVTDQAGKEALSAKQTITWLDSEHKWKSITQGNLTLHWYTGAQSFAQSLVDSANKSLTQLKQQTGVNMDSPVDLYIYASSDDMQKAILYAPGWTGGQAFPEYDIVIIGISPAQLDWGGRTEAHELTHVLVGHLAFTCLGTIPTWLNEGIAMYGQGGPEQASLTNFNSAVKSNKLPSIEALSGQFSENANEADLSYAQSYSIVSYLIKTYGQDKINSLFKDIARGLTIDAALRDVYGFGLDDLDAAWRKSVGAPPPQNATPVAATPAPTAVPTYPLRGIPMAASGSAGQGAALSQGSTAQSFSYGGFSLPIVALLPLPVILVLVGLFVYVRKRKSL